MKAKAIAYCIIFLFAYTSLLAQQNIVLNGDFEEFSDCPDYEGEVYKCYNWIDAGGAVRYFNACDTIDSFNPQGLDAGDVGVPYNTRTYSYAQSGNAYIALAVISDSVYYYNNPSLNRRDIAKGKLKYPLQAGQCYDFKMYVKMATRTGAISDRIGAYFTNQEQSIFPAPIHPPFPLVDTSRIIYLHQPLCDTTEWHLVADKYTAIGGEKYIYISNFFSDEQSEMVYCYQITNDNDMVNHCGFYLIDNVSLIDCDSLTTLSESPTTAISIYPNPTTGDLHIVNPQDNTLLVEIVSPLGQTVDKQTIVPGSNYLNVAILPSGIYLLRIVGQGQSMSQRLVIAQ